MRITEETIKQAHKEHKADFGGQWQDYFGAVYLETFHKVPIEQGLRQVCIGRNDFGIDGFHYDDRKGYLYLFQFKWTKDHEPFKESVKQLVETGVAQAFSAAGVEKIRHPLLDRIRSTMRTDGEDVQQVLFHFVFLGDPEKAENSTVLGALNEDLGGKKHLMDSAVGRDISLVVEYRSMSGKRSHAETTKTHEYDLSISEGIDAEGPDGQHMIIGMGRLYDLYSMYRQMGARFFERNIRYSLPEDGSVNRVLMKAFRDIAIDKRTDANIFAFNHNGVTFSAQKVEDLDGTKHRITEPRLLNGAQTITTLAGFLEKNADRPDIESIKDRLRKMQVICKIITDAEEQFITSVTINNNRQNPVAPWNLRANDSIQLQLSDMFKDRLGIFYERQERAFESLTEEEREEQGVAGSRAIEMRKLAQTFLASDGDLVGMRSMQKVFEDDKPYEAIFNSRRLTADPRYIVLCYKIQLRLPAIMRALIDRGTNKYDFVKRGRHLLWALLCQGVLNDERLDEMAKRYGQDVVMSTNYAEWLSKLGGNQCRHLLGDLAERPEHAESISRGDFNFMRSRSAFDHCMEVARRMYGWEKKRLQG